MKGDLNTPVLARAQRFICPKCNVVVEDSPGFNRGGKCALGHRLERATGTFAGLFAGGVIIGALASLSWYFAPPPGILGTGLGLIEICLAAGGVVAIGQGLIYLFKSQPTKELGARRLGMGLGWTIGAAAVLYLLSKYHVLWAYHVTWSSGGTFVGLVGLVLGVAGAIWIIALALKR